MPSTDLKFFANGSDLMLAVEKYTDKDGRITGVLPYVRLRPDLTFERRVYDLTEVIQLGHCPDPNSFEIWEI